MSNDAEKPNLEKDHKEFFHFYPWGKVPSTASNSTSVLYNSLVDVTSLLLKWVEQNTPANIQSKFSVPLTI